MAPIQVDVAELCAQLYHGFHYNQQNTDVTVECEGQQFLCHRGVLAARSVYFESMFCNVWRESVTGYVVFAEDYMKAATLLEVLKYLYVGNANTTTIISTSSNFMDLLRASDYLGVHGLEAHCVRIMLQDRPEPTVDLLEVLFFAYSVFKQSLINVLASCNMTERFKCFFQTNEFLRIPADLFVVIVSKLWRSPPTMKNVLLRAIYRWRAYALDERKEYALELYELLKPASEILFHLVAISLNSFFRVCSDLETIVAAPRDPSVYVYARDAADKMRTYRYAVPKRFVFDYCYSPDGGILVSRFISIDNVGVFCMTNEYNYFYSTFTQFGSTNIHAFHSGLPLARPPVYPVFFDLCNLSNRGFYLMDKEMRGLPFLNARYDLSKQHFSEREVQRGIYFYNLELDRWYPVPAMIRRQPAASLLTTLDENMVYVIGYKRSWSSIVQAYDRRERRWQKMPNTLHEHIYPQSCVLNGKIYVSSNNSFERYDPTAGRWENIGRLRINGSPLRRLIPFENQLWHFRTYVNNVVEVYEPRTAAWSVISSLTNILGGGVIMDAVVW